MTAADPGAALRELLARIASDRCRRGAWSPMLVKICGITRLEDARGGGRRRRDGARLRLLAGEPALHRSASRARDRRGAAAVCDAGRRVRRTSRPTYVNGVASLVRLGAVQLHGDETPAYAGGVRRAGDQGGRASDDAATLRGVAGARRRCCSTRTIRCGAAAPGGRSTGRRAADAGAARRDRPGRRADARQRRRRDRARPAVRHRRVVGRGACARHQGSRGACEALFEAMCMTASVTVTARS